MFSKVLIRVSVKNFLFTVPTKVFVALRTMHLVATVNFLYRSVACWTWPKLKPVALGIQIEIKVFLAFTVVPLLATLEARRLSAYSAHSSVTTAAWLM